MSAAKDKPVSKVPTDQFRENFDRIFGKKDKKEPPKKQAAKGGDTNEKVGK